MAGLCFKADAGCRGRCGPLSLECRCGIVYNYPKAKPIHNDVGIVHWQGLQVYPGTRNIDRGDPKHWFRVLGSGFTLYTLNPKRLCELAVFKTIASAGNVLWQLPRIIEPTGGFRVFFYTTATTAAALLLLYSTPTPTATPTPTPTASASASASAGNSTATTTTRRRTTTTTATAATKQYYTTTM